MLWILDNPSQSSGLDLEVTTDEVSLADIAETFTRVTGQKAVHRRLTLEEYLPRAEPYPNAPAMWAAGEEVRQKEGMTWRENFTGVVEILGRRQRCDERYRVS